MGGAMLRSRLMGLARLCLLALLVHGSDASQARGNTDADTMKTSRLIEKATTFIIKESGRGLTASSVVDGDGPSIGEGATITTNEGAPSYKAFDAALGSL